LLAIFRPLLSVVPVTLLPLALLCFLVLGRFSSPALRRALAESLVQVSPSALRARARAALAVDVSAALPRINVPVLYLRALEDRVVPKSASQVIVALVPVTNLVDFSAPHFFFFFFPSQAAATVSKFMACHCGS
jgi:pimeloyl-ACP methyl ester carboxylesterase